MTTSITGPDVLWGLAAVGERMRCSTVEVFRRLRDGRLKGERVLGRWAVRVTDVDACLRLYPLDARRQQAGRQRARTAA